MANSTEPTPTLEESDRPAHRQKDQLLGWQGVTLRMPGEWNLASFGGDAARGNLRVDDADGVRLELRWEPLRGNVDLQRSVTQFLERLRRSAAKKRQPFEVVENPRLVVRGRKHRRQLTNFGWRGSQDDPAGHGWGSVWNCSTCSRVMLAHYIGRGGEPLHDSQEQAASVLSSLECHGTGGWQTWSVFDLKLEVPQEFRLGRARLLTGRIEIEWLRPPPPPPRGWGRHPERIAVVRAAPADVVLDQQSLQEWTRNSVAAADRKRRYGPCEDTRVPRHDALQMEARPRHPRRVLSDWAWATIMRRSTPPARVLVWHCPQSNKILVLDCELSSTNQHVCSDVLDSLQCHR